MIRPGALGLALATVVQAMGAGDENAVAAATTEAAASVAAPTPTAAIRRLLDDGMRFVSFGVRTLFRVPV